MVITFSFKHVSSVFPGLLLYTDWQLKRVNMTLEPIELLDLFYGFLPDLAIRITTKVRTATTAIMV